MIVQPIDYLLITWFALAILSTAYVGWDQFRNNPEPAVMRIATSRRWILTTRSNCKSG
jgi:hypothetical protein